MTVVVSTHLDDAVFSCYSLLGPDTVVVTVLAGVPPEGVLGDWDAAGGAASSRERVLERRAEDERALALSGARAVHLDFLDSQYWRDGAPPALDGLDAYLTGDVYAPAGIGNSDHVLVRDAVLAVRPDAVLYGDLPYAQRHGFGGIERELVLGDALLEEKLAASRCYATQLVQLEADFPGFLDGLGRERVSR